MTMLQAGAFRDYIDINDHYHALTEFVHTHCMLKFSMDTMDYFVAVEDAFVEAERKGEDVKQLRELLQEAYKIYEDEQIIRVASLEWTKLNQTAVILSMYVGNDFDDIKNIIIKNFCPKGVKNDQCITNRKDCEKCWNRGN